MEVQQWLCHTHRAHEQEVSVMWSLFKVLRRRSRFASLERALLQALPAYLPEEARIILVQQIEAVNFVYRDRESGEVNLYFSKKNPPPRFPNQRLEARWCTVYYRIPSKIDLLKVRLYLVNGHLFTLAFGKIYRQVASESEIHIEQVVFHIDVMQPVSESLPFPVREEKVASSLDHLPRWCIDLGRQWHIEQVSAPLLPEEFQHRLQEIETTLPADYLEIVQVCEGFRVADAVVRGLTNVQVVHLPSGAYYILAERGGGYLGVQEGQKNGQVYYLHHEYSEPLAHFPTFAEALEYLLRRSDLP